MCAVCAGEASERALQSQAVAVKEENHVAKKIRRQMDRKLGAKEGRAETGN